MTPCVVYILECADGTYYVGPTSDLELRLHFHESGEGCQYTSKRLPLRLVYHEIFPDVAVAIAREKQIKRWSHLKKAALVRGDTKTLHELSRRRTREKR